MNNVDDSIQQFFDELIDFVAGKICNRKQVTVPRPTGHDSDKDEKEDVEVNVTKRKGENETDHVTEAKKRRESDGEVRKSGLC